MVLLALTLVAAAWWPPFRLSGLVLVAVIVEVVYAAVCCGLAASMWEKMPYGSMLGRVFVVVLAPELTLYFLALSVKEELGDRVGGAYEAWERWLGRLSVVTYRRAFCGVLAALAGLCLTVVAYARDTENLLVSVPKEFVLLVGVICVLSIATTARGGTLGEWFAYWCLGAGVVLLWGYSYSPALAPFSITFAALWFGRFTADLFWKVGTDGGEIALDEHSQ